MLLVGVGGGVLVGLVEGLDGLLQDRLHPRPPLLPQPPGDAHHRVGGAVAVGEDAGVQQVDARRSRVVRQVDEPHPVDEGLRHVLQQSRHQVCVGVYDDDGVAVPALGLLLHLVGDEVMHQRGLAHAGAGHVEVVAAQQVLGEADGHGLARGGVSHQRASAYPSGRRRQPPGAGALHQGRLVSRAGRVPQGRRLADSQDAAPPEQAGACGVQHVRVGDDRLHLPHLEPRPRGVVEVAVGEGHRLKQLGGPLRPRVGGQHGDDLELGVEGDPGDFFAYQQRVFHPLAGLLPAVPRPTACEQAQGRADAEKRRLPYLPVLHPQVALQGRQRPDAEDGHRHAVQLQGLGLVGVGGLSRLHAGTLVCLVHVRLRPVGAEGAQHQPRHGPLTGPEGRQSAQKGDEGVRAGVEQVVVPEHSQGHVLGAVGPEGHRPRLLSVAEPQGVLAGVYLLDAGLGIVGGDLAAHHPVVEAAGHERHAVGGPGELQGEGFRHGDGLEEVLHPQQGALTRPGRRHRKEDGGLLSAVVSKQKFLRVQFHGGMPSFLCLGGVVLRPFRISIGLLLRSRLSYL